MDNIMTSSKHKPQSAGFVPSFRRDAANGENSVLMLGKPVSDFGAIQIVYNDKLLTFSADYLLDYQLYKEYMIGYEPLSQVEITDILQDLFTFARISVAMFESKTGTLLGSALSHLMHEASQMNALRLDRSTRDGLLLTIDLTRFTVRDLPSDTDWIGNYQNWPDLLIFRDGFSQEMRILKTNEFSMSFANWLKSSQNNDFFNVGLSIIHHLIDGNNEVALDDTDLSDLHLIMPYIIKNKLFTVHDEGSNGDRDLLSWVVCAGCIQSHILHDENGCKTMGFTTEGNNINTTCASMSLTRID